MWPGWAPGGRKFVAVDDSEVPRSLVLMRVDGGLERRIAIPPAEHVVFPRWSPAGRWIVYQQATEVGPFLWRVRPDGSDARRLGGGELATWAPSGRRIAYTDGRDIWSMRPDGSGRRRLSRGPDGTDVGGLAVVPGRPPDRDRPGRCTRTSTTPQSSPRSPLAAAVRSGGSAAGTSSA